MLFELTEFQIDYGKGGFLNLFIFILLPKVLYNIFSTIIEDKT
jgi:hypothetical protein